MLRCIFIMALYSKYTLSYEDSRCVDQERVKDKVVETKQGRLVGKREIGMDERQNFSVSWTSFYDIPYALPPLGNLRFQPPIPEDSWTCVRDASFTEDKICPQIKIN